jgi:hypothetical protein
VPTIVYGPDNFNHAITTPTFYDFVFGSPTSDTAVVLPSTPTSLKVPSAGGNVGVRKNIVTSLPWVGFFFRTESLPASGLFHIVALHPGTAGNDEMRIYLGSDGIIKSFYTGGGAVVGTYTYTPATWIWIEAISDFVTGTYNGYWRIDEVDQPSPTKVGEAADNSDYVQLLSYSGDATRDWYASQWYIGLASGSTDFMGRPGTSYQQIGSAKAYSGRTFGPF